MSTEPNTRINSRPVRNYSDIDKAKTLAVLDSQNGNVLQTQRLTGIHEATIRYWRNGNVNNNIVEAHEKEKEELSNRFENLAHLYISQAVDTVESSKGTSAITGAGIAVDKMRLLRDQPTVITTQNIDPVASAFRSALDKHRRDCELTGDPAMTDTEIIDRINATAKSNNVDAIELRARVLESGE